MRVAIVGAGPIGRATAAFLAHSGHDAGLYSPSGRSIASLAPTDDGRLWIACEGEVRARVRVRHIRAPEGLVDHDVVLIALPGHAYPAVLPRVVSALHARQLVIVSGALSLAPLWIHARLGPSATVVGWGTTLGTARHTPTADVKLNTLRARFDMAAVPASRGPEALDACEALFGPRFNLADNVLAVALANVNPVAHAAEVLPNLTRIDRRERWPLFECMTASAARLCCALDRERLCVASAFGARVRSIEEHYRLSYHVAGDDIAALAAAIHEKYPGAIGPTTLEHRYVLEDVPFGLVFTEALARCAAVEVPNTTAAITLLSSACGRDFRAENPLLDDLAIASATPAALLARCRGADL